MILDPSEEARKRAQEAENRLKVKREIRSKRREGRERLLKNIEQAQAALDAYDAETSELLEAYPRIEAARNERKRAFKEYDDAVREGTEILQNADPRPGKMGREAEQAQNRIVSAYLVLEEYGGEIDEIDEY